MIPVILLNHLAQNFYILNPGYKIHGLGAWRLAFHPELIPECFAMPGKLFAYLMPVIRNGGKFVFYFLVLLCTLLFIRKKYIYACCGLSGIIIIIYSFGLAKIQDGSDDLVLPFSRMFLAVPLLYGILISWLFEKSKYANLFVACTFILGVSCFTIKSAEAKEKTASLVKQQLTSPMLLYPVSALMDDCTKFSRIAKENNVQLIAGIQLDCRWDYLSTLFSGCDVLSHEFPLTIFPEHDRRTWRFYEEEKSVRKNILFVGGNDEFWNGAAQKGFLIKKISENPFVCVLENNNMNTIELMRKLTIPLRNY